jgi:hypothetical protein
MKNIFIIILFLSLAKISFAANDTIIVIKDVRLNILTKKEIQLNKHAGMLTSTGQYKGFRVQAISTSNREQAFKMKADLLANFSDEKSYVLFQAPYFKVRIGNFINRSDADKFRTQLNNFFKQNMYVVEDVIEYTLPDDEDSQ